MDRPKILFFSCYSEALKTFIPIINFFKKKYDVHIVASSNNINKEIIRNEEICKSSGVNYDINMSKNPIDKYPSSYIPLIARLLFPFFLIRTKFEAIRLLKKIKPDIVVVAADKREYERLLIDNCKKNQIPTICFQWALGPVTKTSFFENKNEVLIKNYKPKKNSIISYVLRIPSKIITLLFNLKTPNHADCYGGGDAKILTCMGEGSKKYFVSMGVPENKIKIIGHPLIEKSYYQDDDLLMTKTILYATCYKKADYYKIVSRKDVYKYRYDFVNEITRNFKHNNMIMKLHPNEDKSEFHELESSISNFSIIDSGEINDLINSCQIFISRASTAILYAMVFNKPVITFNFPSLPMGDVYKEIGGTLHATNMGELIHYIRLIEKNDEAILNEIKKRRGIFLKQYLNIDTEIILNKNDTLPSIQKFSTLINNQLNYLINE